MNEMRELIEAIEKIEESKVTFRQGLKLNQDEWRTIANKLEEASVFLNNLVESGILGDKETKEAEAASDAIDTAMWNLRLR